MSATKSVKANNGIDGCTPSHAADAANAAAADGIVDYHRCIITKASVTSVHILVVALREGLLT